MEVSGSVPGSFAHAPDSGLKKNKQQEHKRDWPYPAANSASVTIWL